MLPKLLTSIFGSRNDRLIKSYSKTVQRINALEPVISALSDDALRAKTAEFKERLTRGEMLDDLLPRYVETEFYRALSESVASEHAARMTAMDAATSNAADMIEKLTLYMNRVRQSSITKEIIEVVSGAAAAE